MNMVLTGKNFIGNFLSAEGQELFQAEDPSTLNRLEPGFHEATKSEIDRSINMAASAFSRYRVKSHEERALLLESIADGMMEIGDDLIDRCKLETGLPEARLKNERGRTVNQLKLFASCIREGSWVDARVDAADPTRVPPAPDIRSMERPLGPIGIFGASNFPLAFSVAGGDTASALAAGCTVVFKAHPAHPGTSELVATAIINAVKKSNMPEGTFSMIHGKSNTTGMEIARHPLIKALAFTGSYRGGKALFDIAVARPEPIPVYAEMGSTNPVFLLPGALKERKNAIAKELTASVTLGAGQFCTNPGLVFLPSSETAEFLTIFSRSMEETATGPMLTSGIHQAYVNSITRLCGQKGVEVIARGRLVSPGCQAPPGVFKTSLHNFLSDGSLEEEVFGPSTLLVTTESKADIIAAAEKLHGHLTATIHGTPEDLKEYGFLISILEQKVGRIIINGYPTGVEVTHAMVHGGPFPATTDSRMTSVGTNAIRRFTRPVCYQDFPQNLLPDALKDDNPSGIRRLVNGKLTL